MRLLYTTSNRKLKWTEDLIGDKIPPYAILSHTWKEGQEVTFDDLKNLDNVEDNDAQNKEGYEKLRFCAQQAQKDGLDYFWIDTCCIDKSNSSELQEAINSMFHWYQNAKKCYVYLSDVEKNALDDDDDDESAFKKSRWFARGWTLQELLAPTSVEFFSKEGARLGDKESLKHIVQEITGIPIDALSGKHVSEFSVADRFLWAGNRRTTRPEDEAYCLLGMFDIHLPLIYGEGKKKALKRLRKEIQESGEDDASAPVNDTGTHCRSQKETLAKICQWLSAPDPSTNYHKAHKQRQAETGLWLLQSASFTAWKENAGSQLWLYGIPGCGKTILSSTIIETLQQHCHDNINMVTVYFYFDFNDPQKQNPELLLHSLFYQLLQHSLIMPRGVNALFSSCGNGQRQPSMHALLEVMLQVIQQFTHVYIVLDALDECTQRSELMDVLATIAKWELQNLHLLMTSRRERDIESSLGDYLGEDDAICLQSEVVDKDIQQYVQQRLSSDKSLVKWKKDESVRQEIEATLMREAHGMFRWAACQLDALGKCRSRAMLRRALATLPPTLDQTYDRILCAISEEDSEYALRILQWLTFSARPLSPEEVAEAVAIDVTREPAFDRDDVLEDPLEALNICSSLVTLTMDDESGRRIIALAHYSVQEYLVSDRIRLGQAKTYSMQEAVCQHAITQGCLQYLLQLQQPDSSAEEELEMFALARYSARYWSHHFRKTEDKMGEMSLFAMSLFSNDNPAYFHWIRLCDPVYPYSPSNLTRTRENIPNPLHYAVVLGFTTIVELLLDGGPDIDAKNEKYGDALHTASFHGQEQVVRVLLDKGANVNAQSGFYGNALQAASSNGYEQIVKTLLDRGANVNAEGGYCGFALQAASNKGHEQVVELLLDRGAEVNAEGGRYGHALQAAALRDHKHVVKILLDRGADANVMGEHYSALQTASRNGYEQVVKILLDRGAKIDVDHEGYNVLEAAGEGGNVQIAKMILDRGADVNAQGGNQYGNALQAASQGGHKDAVRLLLHRGADINMQGGHYGTALQAASQEGHEQVVKLLLDRGADVDAQGGGLYRTALQAALAYGHKQVVRILLEAGAQQAEEEESVSESE